MPTKQPIDTAKVSERRILRFTTLDEVQADVDKLAIADREGRARCLGNWTLGQNFGHLASWVIYSFDGVPMSVPFFVRWVMRPMKNRVLYKPMAPGSRIPKVPGGTLGIDPISTADGLAQITTAYARLKSGPPAIPHLLFGPMTHEEWINQHLRHAELHLSFCKLE